MIVMANEYVFGKAQRIETYLVSVTNEKYALLLFHLYLHLYCNCMVLEVRKTPYT